MAKTSWSGKYGEAVAVAAEKRRKSDRYKFFCQANPKAKGCKPKDKDSRNVVTNAKGEGTDKGGGSRKKIGTHGDLIPYASAENEGPAPKKVSNAVWKKG